MKNINLEKEDGLAIITITRPPMNTLNTEMLLEMREVLNQLEKDNTIKILIITGAGEKAFVAGADISEMKGKTESQGLEFGKLGQGVLNQIENLPKPVIAAVNGYALGGGTELAMACDIIIASEKAKFGQPEVNLGLIPGFGGTQRLPRLVSKNIAKELIFTGDIIDANEAYRIGLANKVVKQEELMQVAKAVAKKILTKGLVAVKLAKSAINKGTELELEKALELEAKNFSLCFTTEDAKEGMSAFLEKRAAKFQNR